MMICKETNRLNYLANHEDNRLFLGDNSIEYMDLSAFVSHPLNIFMDGEHGGFTFSWSAPRVYEVHAFVLKSGRGKWSAKAFNECLDFIWRLGSEKVWTRVAQNRRDVLLFARRNGMSHVMTTFGSTGSAPEPIEIFEIKRPICLS